jgi:hypothetical protein
VRLDLLKSRILTGRSTRAGVPALLTVSAAVVLVGLMTAGITSGTPTTNPVMNHIAFDTSVHSDQRTPSSTIVSPPISTADDGELLVMFLATDGRDNLRVISLGDVRCPAAAGLVGPPPAPV